MNLYQLWPTPRTIRSSDDLTGPIVWSGPGWHMESIQSGSLSIPETANPSTGHEMNFFLAGVSPWPRITRDHWTLDRAGREGVWACQCAHIRQCQYPCICLLEIRYDFCWSWKMALFTLFQLWWKMEYSSKNRAHPRRILGFYINKWISSIRPTTLLLQFPEIYWTHQLWLFTFLLCLEMICGNFAAILAIVPLRGESYHPSRISPPCQWTGEGATLRVSQTRPRGAYRKRTAHCLDECSSLLVKFWPGVNIWPSWEVKC